MQRSVAAIRYEVEAVDAPARIVVQSELVANEPLPKGSNDPRMAAVLGDALVAQQHGSRGLRAVLRRSRAAQRVEGGLPGAANGT